MVNQIGGVSGPNEINPLSNKRSSDRSNKEGSSVARRDSVHISEQGKQAAYVAELKESLAEVPEVRSQRIAEIKDQIARGVYLTDAKLDNALDNLIDDVI